MDEYEPLPSPGFALVPVLEPEQMDGWHTILEASNQVVLYNPASHALTVTSSQIQPLPSPALPSVPVRTHQDGAPENCPYCHRPLMHDPESIHEQHREATRVPNYFHLLAMANETASRPASPGLDEAGSSPRPFSRDSMAEGYFSAFFRETKRLGMGASGTVWLCEHVLDGNALGHYAVKKIAVGHSHDYLMNTLREVRLLETLRHPNIITYHHAWLESHKFSSFGEAVPTLFILMQWAEGGSLDDFILKRQVVGSSSENYDPNSSTDDLQSRSDRIRAYRAARKGGGSTSGGIQPGPKRETKAIHLLSREELRSLFGDIATGLAFLHDRGILHLDLKPGNVLLTLDEGRMIPRAMLSDFGTSQDVLNTARTRSGNTGTLEYAAPETLNILRSVDSKADMWSLGMILYKLLFFKLPYLNEDIPNLEKEVAAYPGFTADADTMGTFSRRGFPSSILVLLQSLLDTDPQKRPSCERVLSAMKSGKFDTVVRSNSSPGPLPIVKRVPPLVEVFRDQQSQNGGDSQRNGDLVRRASSASDQTVGPPSSTGSPIMMREKTPLLTLPSPPPPEVPNDTENGTLVVSRAYRRLSRPFLIQLCKSGILAAKMVHLNRLCPYSMPRTHVVCLTVGLAVIDTWTDSLLVSAALGAAHIGVLALLRDHGCTTV